MRRRTRASLATLFLLVAPVSASQDRGAELEARVAELERTAGPMDAKLAAALNDLAVFYFGQSDYARAEPLLRRTLAIRDKALGPEDPLTALAMNNLAQVLQERGNYLEAEPLLERALSIQEKLRGPDHPDVAVALNNLAGLWRVVGNYRRAEPLYLRAIAIREKTVGPDHASLAPLLNNLALMYQQEGDLAKARPLFERSLAIREKALGPDHVDVGRALNNLAVISQEQGNLTAAEPLYLRAIAIYEKTYGRNHALVGQALNNLAVVYLLQGNYAKAGPLYGEAIAIRTAVLGASHPDMPRALTSQAIYFDVTGQADRAIARQGEAADVAERTLALMLTTGSEVQKIRYIDTLREDTDITLSMHLQSAPANPAAARLAMTTMLRRKGRVLDAVSGTLQRLRDRMSDADRALLDKLSDARGRLAAAVLRGPVRQEPAAFAASVRQMEDLVEEMERAVSQRSAAYRVLAQPVTIEAVQAALPAGSALLEIALYRPFNNRVAERDKRFAAARYVAYVLTPRAGPVAIDLGDAAGIDRQVDAFRGALRNAKSAPAPAARALYAAVIAPLLPALGGAERLLVSPDGVLNLVPFAALVNPSGKYLLETHEVSYLTSGRDLLRLQERAAQSSAALVVADPAFDAAGTATDSAGGSRAADLSRARFPPLPGTAAEARALNGLLPGAVMRTGTEATEAVVKGAHGPQVLHLATHGFFLDGEDIASASGTRLLVQGPATGSQGPGLVNPLLRSGLAFAGANQRRGGGDEDGILTALEASSLDLWGTRMAVLSACETGVGEARRGDGVYGLRRALVIAGAESQVMSLWQVSDEGTRALMTAFYTKLKTGGARSAMLRDVQREMLRSGKRAHPYYWASFILSGADGPIAFQ